MKIATAAGAIDLSVADDGQLFFVLFLGDVHRELFVVEYDHVSNDHGGLDHVDATHPIVVDVTVAHFDYVRSDVFLLVEETCAAAEHFRACIAQGVGIG